MNERAHQKYARVRELAEKVCEARVSTEEQAELSACLLGDRGALRDYLRYIDVHGMLVWTNGVESKAADRLAAPQFDLTAFAVAQMAAAPQAASDAATVAGPTPAAARQKTSSLGALLASFRFSSHPYRFSSLVAGVALTVALAFFALVRFPSVTPAPVNAADREPAVMAHVTGAVDAAWGARGGAKSRGDYLHAGETLDLVAGYAEISFLDGAVVVVEAPSLVQIRSAGKIDLKQGRLTVRVPKRAAGFTVATATLTAVDLGTEFGVLVDDHGQTEVHVFSGRVATSLVANNSNQSASPALEISAGQGVRAESGQSALQTLLARRDVFTFRLPSRSALANADPRNSAEAGTLLLYEGFGDTAHLQLAGAAGGIGWAEPWRQSRGDVRLERASLEYADFLGNRLLTSGGAVRQEVQSFTCLRPIALGPESAAARQGLVDPQSGKLGAVGSTLWLSFLGRGYTIDRENNPYAILGLFEDGDEKQRLSIGKFGHTAEWNVNGGNSLQAYFTESVFVVARIDFHAHHERVRVWMNGPLNAEPGHKFPPTVDFECDNFQFDTIVLAGNQAFSFDEFRMGTSFASVAPHAAPPAPRRDPSEN